MVAVDLFSGAGGMSLGFKRAGFKVKAAFDNDNRHIATYKTNFPNIFALESDIHNLSGEYITNACDAHEQIAVVLGGSPCQGFSVGGKKTVNDKRNSLILEFARIIHEVKPKAFVLENVTGILSPQYADLVNKFHLLLKKAGYIMPEKPYILDAREFNIPQRRRRVFFIGVQKECQLPPFPTPLFSNAAKELSRPTVNDAISDLPIIEDNEQLFDVDRYYRELGKPRLYAQELRKSRSLEDNIEPIQDSKNGLGGCRRTRHSPEVEKRFAKTAPGSQEPISRFYRLKWNGTSPTLRAGTTRDNGQHMAPRPIHPDRPRCITVREAARLHSFPDWFEFYPTKWYGFMQVGNSVPPYMAEAVANSLKSVMSQ